MILVVPCYNEAGRMKPAVFLEAVQGAGDLDLLFVDDGSVDATFRILDELSTKSGGRISVLRLAKNIGKAEAVRAGMLAAFARRPDYVGFWDADLSTPLTPVPEFLAVFRSRPAVEIVIGARVKLLGRDIRRNLLRHYCGRMFATAASLALGIGVYDTQCGAKMFRATAVIRQLFTSPFRSQWIFDVEILARYLATCEAAEAERRIYELPLKNWTDVPGSKLKLRDAPQAIWDLARISREVGRLRR